MTADSGGLSRMVRSGVHWGRFLAEVVGDRVVATRPVADDPDPSAMIGSIAGVLRHECRIEAPMVRAGWLRDREASDRAGRGAEPFVRVDWDDALDLVAGELRRVRDRHGNEAIFGGSGWASAGRFHNPKALFQRFLAPLGGYVGTATNWSFGAASVIVPRIVGSMTPVVGPLSSWETIARHTRLIVAFGGFPAKNVQVNEGGLLRHRTGNTVRGLAESGIDIVYLSPMRDDVAAGAAASWVPLRPSTDAAAMLGLAHTLVVEGLYDAAFVARYCVGFDTFRAYLTGESDGQPKDAAWAGAITGVPAGRLRDLARRMAATRTLVTMSWSTQRADHGEQPCWLTVVLAALLGQIGLPGGGFGIGYGAIDGLGQPRTDVPSLALPAPPNPVSFAVPVARISDMLLDPGGSIDFNGRRLTYPDIRLAYWCGGNPFHHNPDTNRMLAAWRRPETIIVHEPWWTPAARHADIVLPACAPLERNDIGASFWDNGLFAIQRAVPPRGQARTDFAIFSGLADRLGIAAAFHENRDEMGWLRHLYDTARDKAAPRGIAMPDFDTFWEAGSFDFPEPPQPVTMFADFRDDPDGNALKTPSGRIEIASATIAAYGYDDCPGHPVWLEPAEWLGAGLADRFPLHMISNQPSVRLHSQMDMGAVSQAAKIAGREPVTLNPDDAAARGIRAGDLVRIFNDRGACLAGARLSAGIMRGVVQLSTGAWYDPVQPGRIGSLDRHGSANMLTRAGATSRLAQCAVVQSTLVEVERWDGPADPVAAFVPPAVADAAVTHAAATDAAVMRPGGLERGSAGSI